MTSHRSLAVLALLGLTAPACSSSSKPGGSAGSASTGTDTGAAEDDDPAAAVARVELSTTGVLLQAQGETATLTATAYDADGNVVPDVSPTFADDGGGDISVDPATGLVTAQVGLGSGWVEARVGEVASPVALVTVADVRDDVTVLDPTLATDAWEFDPTAEAFGPGTAVSITLTGRPDLEVGEVVLAVGDVAFAGEVLELDPGGSGAPVLTIGWMPIWEAFDDLLIDGEVPLREAIVNPALLEAGWVAEEVEPGVFEFTPPPELVWPAVDTDADDGTGGPPPPPDISRTTVCSASGAIGTVKLKAPSLRVDLQDRHAVPELTEDGLAQVGVSGRAVLSAKPTVEVSGGLSGGYACSYSFLIVPLPGPLRPLASIDLRGEASISGSVSLAEFTAGMDVSLEQPVNASIVDRGDEGWDPEVELGDTDLDFEPVWTSSGLSTGLDDLRLQAAVGLGPAIELIALPAEAMRFKRSVESRLVPPSFSFPDPVLAKIWARVSFGGDWRTVPGQAIRPTYASAYKLELQSGFTPYPLVDRSVDLSGVIGNVQDLIGISIDALDIVFPSIDLGRTATGRVDLPLTEWEEGVPQTVSVQLDRASTLFPAGIGVYNVSAVRVYRVRLDSDGSPLDITLHTELPAAADQTLFTWSHTPTADDFRLPTVYVPVVVPELGEVFEVEVGSDGTVPMGGTPPTRLSGRVYTGDASAIVTGSPGDRFGEAVALVPGFLGAGHGVMAVAHPDTSAVYVGSRNLIGMSSAPATEPDTLVDAYVAPTAVPVAAVGAAGDVNNDGYGDMLVGAPSGGGEAWLLLGPLTGGGSLASADARWTGAPEELLGAHVGPAGDMDGDGVADLLVAGDATADATSWLVYGVDASEGAVPTGEVDAVEATMIRAGGGTLFSVAGGFDVDGDGLSDVLHGTPDAGVDGLVDRGSFSLILGQAGRPSQLLDSDARLYALGTYAHERLGTAVAALPDFNGDGYGDLAVSALHFDSPSSKPSAVYLWYGGPRSADGSGGVRPLPEGQLDPEAADWRLLTAGVDDLTGASLAVGDYDGDGRSDLFVGAWSADRSFDYNEGIAYLVRGIETADRRTVDLFEDADARLDGTEENEYLGYSVATGGDIDGDGLDDVAVGAPGWGSGFGTEEGRALLYLSGE